MGLEDTRQVTRSEVKAMMKTQSAKLGKSTMQVLAEAQSGEGRSLIHSNVLMYSRLLNASAK
jgi:hypothetical protein